MVPVTGTGIADVAIVGAGLFGLTLAERLTVALPGISVLVVEATGRIGGLCSSQWHERLGVHVHPRGTHVLATDDAKVWAFAAAHTRVIRYRHHVHAAYRGRLIPLPLGLEAVEAVFGGPLAADEARRLVDADRAPYRHPAPATVEQAALGELGPRLYEAFVHHHVAKQWGADPADLAPEVFTSRFGLRYTRGNRYHQHARWQGLPAGGWGSMLHRLADRSGIRVQLGHEADASDPPPFRHALVVTSPIDAWFGHRLGRLERRSLAVDWRPTRTRTAPTAPTVTYPDPAVPYYRTHTPSLLPGAAPTLTSRQVLVGYERAGTGERQVDFVLRSPGNLDLADAYRTLGQQLNGDGQFFAGRGTTFYDDMATTIAAAMHLARRLTTRLRTVHT
ncbi:UDP-galactopyranose mutase [Kitasatospora sp. NPDC089509]|uniref:UDP-galactopyranose mutase n=1 Tax=Kitasatospora sp. NPDC089509 TaxID=3364079 RepID=UPI0038066260